MNDVLRFSIKKNGLYTSLPYVALWMVALCTGFLSDFLIKRKYLGITNSRKVFTSIGKRDDNNYTIMSIIIDNENGFIYFIIGFVSFVINKVLAKFALNSFEVDN